MGDGAEDPERLSVRDKLVGSAIAVVLILILLGIFRIGIANLIR